MKAATATPLRLLRLAALGLSLLAVAGCSADPEIRGGAGTATTSTASPEPTTAPSDEGDDVEEVAPGIAAPSSPLTPSASPSILRSKEAAEAARFAQGLASALMYNEAVFAPKDRPLRAVDLQFVPGLSAFALNTYYSWILDDKTYAKYADEVAGLVFIPPQNVGKRGYAVPAVQDQEYSDLVIKEGPPSTVDGSPTIRVGFTLTGRLMWQDEAGQYWQAPISRNINYVVAEQNGNWSLDAWESSQATIGKESTVEAADAAGVRFSLLEPPDFDLEAPPGMAPATP